MNKHLEFRLHKPPLYDVIQSSSQYIYIRKGEEGWACFYREYPRPLILEV